jgi:dTDP-4-dehydrorhamnose reductase
MPPPKVDETPEEAIKTNIIGTSLITLKCIEYGIKLVYISTDYVFKGDRGNYKEEDEVFPVNKYAWSKLGGECAVKLYDKGLVVRTTFGKRSFPYEKAFSDQWTSKEPVDVFAKKLVAILNKDICGVIHIGGSRKTVYEYAKEVSPDKEIGKMKIKEMLPKYILPRDTSLNTDKYDRISRIS